MTTAHVRTGLTCAIHPLRPRPASRNRLALPANEADVDVGQTQHPKTDIVVTVVRMVVVAVRRAHVVRIIVPGTAAQHTILVSGNPTKRQNRSARSVCRYYPQNKSKKLRAAPLRGAQWTAAQRLSVQRASEPLFDGGRT
ncbi:hypothetical protein SAMN05216326_13310 [Nitrosomonas marina]|uniref:Uncharacterized protein n=1 Tax=Nitrosomonas marina TaxID=917 RepID=A0A1I0F5H0_9PROT|nr:hypothetical protein [Nitrosomonas marina]SET52475.1 hypothetical protein SAMN05216326_13310 [Nitrosomonas marina]